MSDDYKAKLRAGSDPLVFFKREDELEDSGIARGHIMAAAISHALRDGETLFIGANPLIPFAGARLAQLTHAPNLTMIAGASGGVNPPPIYLMIYGLQRYRSLYMAPSHQSSATPVRAAYR
jgi:acyl CoA:acetate/3-ketoacid CoA transferase beta subunit